MGKALIVSDSHGLKEELLAIKKKHENEVDLMIHCGDSELMSHSKELEGFVAVKGNMDLYGRDLPKDAIEQLGDRCIYVTHGHLYDVKMSHMSLAYRAEETGASIVCFGHSHIAEAYEREGMILINPGSIRLPRGSFEKTYCILEIEAEMIKVSYYNLEGHRIESLSKEFDIKSNAVVNKKK
jgi:uncharacterized protein